MCRGRWVTAVCLGLWWVGRGERVCGVVGRGRCGVWLTGVGVLRVGGDGGGGWRGGGGGVVGRAVRV